MKALTVELGPLDRRAAIGTADTEQRTVEVVFTTGERVMRMDWMTGKRYWEGLSLKPEHIRLDRLNAGAPVLDSHSGYSVSNVLGTVVDKSVKLSATEGRATLKFSKRDDVTPIWNDVVDGVIRNVSVGYRVHKFEETAAGPDGIPVRTAVDWEPYEISLVPMGADSKAKTRGESPAEQLPCVVVTREMEEVMPEAKTTEVTPATETRTAPPAQPVAAPVNIDAARQEAATEERARAEAIQTLGRTHQLDATFVADMVKRGITVEAAKGEILTKLAARTDDTTETHHTVTAGEDARDKFVRGGTNWLLARSGMASLVAKHEGTTVAKMEPGEFRGMRLLDIARETLSRAGVSTRGMSPLEIAGQAMSLRSGNGYQSQSDFAVLLENVVHKILRAAYATTPDTWQFFCGIGSASDFRNQNWYRMGALTSLDSLNENGEFKNKSIPDGEKATFSVGTKGNIIGITREVIVNDDLGMVTRLTEMIGRAAKLTIEKAVYAKLGENSGLGPTQSDTNPLFYSASRANVNTSASAITMAGIEADRVVLASQRDPNTQEYLDLRPSVLLVPIGKGGDAKTINDAQFDPADNKFQKPNIVRGIFSKIVDTPRLSGTRRYLFADPSIAPVFMVSFLEGMQEPTIETQEGWRYNGVEMKARLDFGVDVVDYRGAVTNAGA